MRIILLLFTLFFCTELSAQKVLDKASIIICTYVYTYKVDTITGKEGEKDILILQIGDKISKCYSYYSYQVDSLVETPNYERTFWDSFNRTMKKEGVTSSNYFHKRLKTYIYKNYPEGKMTVTDGISSNYFIYEDVLSGISWELVDSTKSVLGYRCQMAVCDFRGRRYVAWFTSDIPFSDGPWKFSGLPGLIMEVGDVRNQYMFTIIGIEKSKKEPIVFSKSISESRKYIKTSRIEFLRGLRQYLTDAVGYIESETGISLTESSKAKKISYDLIERDYR